jgi:high-affinity K+ transport system ATPase subunit B
MGPAQGKQVTPEEIALVILAVSLGPLATALLIMVAMAAYERFMKKSTVEDK